MKYRLGKKQSRAILDVETGHEYLVFPEGSGDQNVKDYMDWLNEKERQKSKSKFEKFMDFIFRLTIASVLLVGSAYSFVQSENYRQYYLYSGYVIVLYMLYKSINKVLTVKIIWK